MPSDQSAAEAVHRTRASAQRHPAHATSGRLLGTINAALGCLLITRPHRLAAAAAGPSGRPAPAWLVRVLGLRSLLQGALTAVAPTDAVLSGGALVDVTHAATMVPLIVVSPRYRRAAALSALAAVVSAGAGTRIARAATPARTSAP